MAEIGIKVNRNVRVHWGDVEPEQGKWNWTEADRRLQCLADNGIETGGVLIGNPAWSSKEAAGKLIVSMWGYNFSLNSDGNKFNNYYIQSVTVSKP